MIKIEKDISLVPDSLQLPLKEFFVGRNIPTSCKTTHDRRLELVQKNNYDDRPIYNSRYKQKNKCAYCETRIEQSHVEHYRPKSKYFWLAYSWDNLLLACSTCNTHKSDHFDISGAQVTFVNTKENLKEIHGKSREYDLVEQPKMINPEVTDPIGRISFERNGAIRSNDPDFAYTIDKCKIDRKDLNDSRRKILDVLERDLRSAMVENSNPDDQTIVIESIIRKFLRDSKDTELQYLGFRRYAISVSLINSILKSLNGA
jgi:uncharacterized protein (TIGR02646 family)